MTQLSHPASYAISHAAGILREGGLVIFPTETVYGIGARAFDPIAVSRIFQVKGRPADNPLIVHIGTVSQLSALAMEIPDVAFRLMDHFWPGPLTLILKRAPTLPPIVSANLDTVAVRMPDHPMALALLHEMGEPIAAPSANRSGRPSPTSAAHAEKELGPAVKMILDGGPCRIGLESTVLDLTERRPCILRPGAITQEMLTPFVGPMAVPQQEARSPGTRHRHYAPNFEVLTVDSKAWPSFVKAWHRPEKRLGMICHHPPENLPKVVYYRHFTGQESDYARDLFSSFHEAEAAGVEIFLVEAVEKQGLGVAIMDRLERAGGMRSAVSYDRLPRGVPPG